MLSQLDALYPHFGLGGFDRRQVETYAVCSLWDKIDGTNKIPIILDLVKIGDLCMIHISGCLGKMEWGGDQHGNEDIITIEYTLPYTFVGKNGQTVKQIIPLERNWDGSKNGGLGYFVINGSTRQIFIMPAEERHTKFKCNEDQVNFPQYLGAEEINVMWNTELVAWKEHQGHHIGSIIPQEVLKDVDENYATSFVYPTRTFSFSNSLGVEEELSIEVDSNNKPINFYPCSAQIVTSRDDGFTFVYDVESDTIEQLKTGTDILATRRISNIKGYVGEKTGHKYLRFNGSYIRYYNFGHIDYSSSPVNFIIGLSENKQSTNKGDWIFVTSEAAFVLDSITYTNEGDTVTVIVNDGNNARTFKISTTNKMYTEVTN